MKYKKILFLIIIVPILTAATIHKFYVTTTRVEYIPQEQSLQIITEIFTDDIEKTLTKRTLKEVHLDSEKETNEDLALLRDYVFNKFVVFVNGIKVNYNYIGLQYDIDRVKLYLEITNVSSLATLEIENTILFDAFVDQQNIIHIKTPDLRRSLVLDKENPKGLLNL
ncbi:MAG: hypothetical protein ACI9RL_000231 [Candidatus Paceibacteria bacterium]|jgi:hypothetical protein